jgi:hypothetical protein
VLNVYITYNTKSDMLVIYREEGVLKEMEVPAVNTFHGANIRHQQVLKSAAGFYVGSLIRADWHEQEFWEPYDRDSGIYWDTRKEAEDALTKGVYPVRV